MVVNKKTSVDFCKKNICFFVLSEFDKSLRAELILISALILLLNFSSVTGEIVKLINVLVLPKTLTKKSAFPQNDYLTIKLTFFI